MTLSKNKEFSLCLINTKDREELRKMIDDVSIDIEQDGFADRLEIIIAELINNAVKANIKRIYFNSKGFSFENKESYQKGLAEFKLNYGHLNFMNYEKALKALQLEVNIKFSQSDKHLLIFVKNNNTMSALEESQIRNDLNKIMNKMPEEMHDIYVHYGDEIEEDSLGLAMAINLFRQMGYDPNMFRVYNEGGFTKARILIPLKKK